VLADELPVVDVLAQSVYLKAVRGLRGQWPMRFPRTDDGALKGGEVSTKAALCLRLPGRKGKPARATDVQQQRLEEAKVQVEAIQGIIYRISDKDEVRGSSPRGPTIHSPGKTQKLPLTRLNTSNLHRSQW
jgi:hypothetical protein